MNQSCRILIISSETNETKGMKMELTKSAKQRAYKGAIHMMLTCDEPRTWIRTALRLAKESK